MIEVGDDAGFGKKALTQRGIDHRTERDLHSDMALQLFVDRAIDSSKSPLCQAEKPRDSGRRMLESRRDLGG